jgi:hypothetical protein
MRTRSARRRYRSTLAALVTAFSVICLFLAASAAQALTINSATSSLDQGIGCGDSFCAFDIIYGLDTPNPSLSGTFDITGGTLNFSINLASATLSVLSGTDGGVTSVEFSGVTISGSVAVAPETGDLFSVTDQPSTIFGTLTPTGAGDPVPFNLVGVNTSGTCNDAPGLSLTCGLTFGAGIFPMQISVNEQPRYFRLTTDIRSVVPEPSTTLLLGLGLCALGRRRTLAESGPSD